MRFDVLSIFPEIFASYLSQSLLNKAIERGLVDIRLWNIRDHTTDKHQKIDDRPFGGGPGMVLKPEPIIDCVEWLERRHGAFHKILLTPAGKPLHQEQAERRPGERT